jgi:thioredoxin-related protein
LAHAAIRGDSGKSRQAPVGVLARLSVRTCAAARLDRVFRVKNLIIAIALTCACSITLSVRADSEWGTDYKKAQQDAKASNKLILLDFTGSDWCGYCIRLDRDVLSKPEFKDYASQNLVLVEIDFPRRKAQSAEVKRQNEELAQQYQIEGFPTLVVLNGDGQTIWRYDGYFSDGPQAFIAQLEKLRKG